MKLHEKIRQIRQNKGQNLVELHAEIKKLFGKNAITYRALQMIQAGHSHGWQSSIHQICMGLGVTLQELKQGTEDEENPIFDPVRGRTPKGRYNYNENAHIDMLTDSQLEFLCLEMTLQPNAKTPVEKDSDLTGKIKFKKWIYVTMGALTCITENKKHILNKGDSITIDSTLQHYFENESSHKTRCIILQIPRHI